MTRTLIYDDFNRSGSDIGTVWGIWAYDRGALELKSNTCETDIDAGVSGQEYAIALHYGPGPTNSSCFVEADFTLPTNTGDWDYSFNVAGAYLLPTNWASVPGVLSQYAVGFAAQFSTETGLYSIVRALRDGTTQTLGSAAALGLLAWAPGQTRRLGIKITNFAINDKQDPRYGRIIAGEPMMIQAKVYVDGIPTAAAAWLSSGDFVYTYPGGLIGMAEKEVNPDPLDSRGGSYSGFIPVVTNTNIQSPPAGNGDDIVIDNFSKSDIADPVESPPMPRNRPTPTFRTVPTNEVDSIYVLSAALYPDSLIKGSYEYQANSVLTDAASTIRVARFPYARRNRSFTWSGRTLAEVTVILQALSLSSGTRCGLSITDPDDGVERIYQPASENLDYSLDEPGSYSVQADFIESREAAGASRTNVP